MSPPTPPKIVLDTNVLKNISEGNVKAAEALNRYLKAGNKVYISRAAYEELVTRAKTPYLRQQYRRMLKELEIEIAPNGGMKGRVDLYADNIQHVARKGQPGSITEYGGKGNTEPGDVFVAAEAKSLNAQLWTFDQKLAGRAKQFGVQLAPESTNVPAVSGPENPVRGMELLGIEAETEIAAIVPRTNISARSVRVVGSSAMRNAAGTAAEVALTLGVAIVLALAQYYMTKSMYERIIKEGLEKAGKEADEKIRQLKPAAASLQLKLEKGEKVYANVVIQIHWLRYTLGAGRGDYLKPEVRLTDVNITTKNLKVERKFEADPLENDGYGHYHRYKRDVDEFTQSFEVTVYSKEELEQFQDVQTEYLAYKRRLGMDPANVKLTEEISELRKQIVNAYGSDVWFLAIEDGSRS
jgi:predicted nucleic acid-binding protein